MVLPVKDIMPRNLSPSVDGWKKKILILRVDARRDIRGRLFSLPFQKERKGKK